MKHSVLLDTSFFVRLLNDEDRLHNNARDYFKYFLEKGITLKISTISIAEYCVKGEKRSHQDQRISKSQQRLDDHQNST